MISCSYIWSWHIWFSYEQPFLYLRSYVCVPLFIHGINGLPISVHRIIGFLMNGLPIIAVLYLRSYDCVFLYPCLPVERGGSAPPKEMPLLFGHCPNGDCTPPPALKRALWGTLFLDQFEQICQITVLTVHKCHKASWQP